MKHRPILLVEDVDDDVRLARRALRQNKITNELVVARDGVEALDYLRQVAAAASGSLPAVVLLDLNLPKMDGIEVLKALRADPVLRRQPIVILTSSKEENDVRRSYDHGANSYIRKPVVFEQFCEAIAQVGRYWLELNEAPPDATPPR